MFKIVFIGFEIVFQTRVQRCFSTNVCNMFFRQCVPMVLPGCVSTVFVQFSFTIIVKDIRKRNGGKIQGDFRDLVVDMVWSRSCVIGFSKCRPEFIY